MNILRKLSNIYLLAPLLCLITYLTRVKPGQINYFNDLAQAFLRGQLHLINPVHIEDLVVFHGKYYLYWPPVPAFVMMPFVLLFGDQVPNGIISSFIGALNVWLFLRICQRLSERFQLGLSTRELFWLGMFWGLGTVHFYMARSGSVWFISQVIAQSFLLAAVYFLLHHRRVALSGLCFALAVYTRNDLVFAAFFFLMLYLALHPGSKPIAVVRAMLVFSVPFLVCSGLNAWYNAARFGNPFDNGLSYHLMAPYFQENFRRYGYFSTHYIPHNFYTEVLHAPTLIPRNPFIKDEPEGFGFIWASPLFFWLYPALFVWVYQLFRRGQRRGFILITTGAWLAAVPIALTIFMIMGTGWRQFAARYTLDFQFFLLVFLLFLWPYLSRIPFARQASMGIIVVSWLIQLIGAS